MVEGDAWSVEMVVVCLMGVPFGLPYFSVGCLAGMWWRAMFQAAAGRDPLFLDFGVDRPLLFLLPSHVAARLLLGRVVSLRLGSDGVVQIDLAVVPVRLLPWCRSVERDGKNLR